MSQKQKSEKLEKEDLLLLCTIYEAVETKNNNAVTRSRQTKTDEESSKVKRKEKKRKEKKRKEKKRKEKEGYV